MRINLSIILEQKRNKNISNKMIADYVGVKESTVSDWLRGKKTPNDDNLQKLCEYLELSVFDVQTSSNIYSVCWISELEMYFDEDCLGEVPPVKQIIASKSCEAKRKYADMMFVTSSRYQWEFNEELMGPFISYCIHLDDGYIDIEFNRKDEMKKLQDEIFDRYVYELEKQNLDNITMSDSVEVDLIWKLKEEFKVERLQELLTIDEQKELYFYLWEDDILALPTNNHADSVLITSVGGTDYYITNERNYFRTRKEMVDYVKQLVDAVHKHGDLDAYGRYKITDASAINTIMVGGIYDSVGPGVRALGNNGFEICGIIESVSYPWGSDQDVNYVTIQKRAIDMLEFIIPHIKK